MTVAVTGPFASGKSTFVGMLAELGAETTSADETVHHLLSSDKAAISRVMERFGRDVRGEKGVDRGALGRQVFGDAEALADLEKILHPLVKEETDRRVAASAADIFAAEIPLLFETGREKDFDLTVAVTVPEERRRSWAAERGVGAGALEGIEARQLSGDEKARRADLVVQNDGGLDRLREQAGRVVAEARRGRSSDSHFGQEA